MSTKQKIRTVPQLPLMVVEKILKYVPSTKDRANCRLVCLKWLYVIDVYVGLSLKLTRANKAKLFASELLRSCPALKILASAGTLNWYVCYFSSRNLKSVEIVGSILSDNWKLLLEQCQSMEFLIITTQPVIYMPRTGVFHVKGKPFDFPADFAENRINHYTLRRVVFKGDIDPSKKAQAVAVANMINSIGIAPQLRQIIVFHFAIRYSGTYLPIHKALLTVMKRNSGVNGVGIFTSYENSYQEMQIWDRLLREDKSCFVQCFGLRPQSHWREMYDRLLNVDELYIGLFDQGHILTFRTMIDAIMRESRKLTKIFLAFDRKQIFNCTVLLQGLQRILELSLCRCHNKKKPSPILRNLNVLTHNDMRLEYLYISTKITEENMDAIFRIPRLKELHIKHQESADTFQNQHFQLAINHPHLKMIFWEKPLQEKWNGFNLEQKCENWDFVQLERKPLKSYLIDYNNPDIRNVAVPDGGLILETEWKNKFADVFVVFNQTRFEDAKSANWVMKITESSRYRMPR